MLKLISIKKSVIPEKKYSATFLRDGRTLTTHFGAAGMSDFTQHHDEERKRRYLSRHQSREDWNEPTTAGALSKHILWGPTTSITANIRIFKRRFDL